MLPKQTQPTQTYGNTTGRFLKYKSHCVSMGNKAKHTYYNNNNEYQMFNNNVLENNHSILKV